jgi:galactose mutarotase-like enzyme
MAHELRETVIEGLDALELCSVEREIVLTLVPGAGMIGASLTHEGRELLHRGGGLAAWTQHGTTFGIPLLHPWANRLERLSYEAGGRHVLLDPERAPVTFDGAGLPIHGLLHASPRWEVRHTHADGGGAAVGAHYDAAGDEALLAGFPFPHTLDLTVSLRTDLVTFTLTLTATGDVPVPVSFGWHPYLRLPGVPRAEWELTLPLVREALLDARSLPTGQTRPAPFTAGALGERSFDDLFTVLADPPEFVLAGGGGALRLRFEDGYRCAQVYSPPGADFICFEPMTAPTDALRRGGAGLRVVAPGDELTASWSLLVEGRPGA